MRSLSESVLTASFVDLSGEFGCIELDECPAFVADHVLVPLVTERVFIMIVRVAIAERPYDARLDHQRERPIHGPATDALVPTFQFLR